MSVAVGSQDQRLQEIEHQSNPYHIIPAGVLTFFTMEFDCVQRQCKLLFPFFDVLSGGPALSQHVTDERKDV